MAQLTLKVNGKAEVLEVEATSMLLYALRDNLGLHGPRFGCGLSQCGACTVNVGGVAVRSCVTPVSAGVGKEILTLEGLSSNGKLHPLQEAFIAEQAAQCGYCLNGMIMQAKPFLEHKPNPSEEEIRQELSNNLCGCGTHLRIVRAVQRAAKAMAGGVS
ncbi:MAG: (2Fe-2S)-binding protein [Thermaceae bacterium]|nr:(2Fe-2S)-binding protein [Thermaceae bacterium]